MSDIYCGEIPNMATSCDGLALQNDLEQQRAALTDVLLLYQEHERCFDLLAVELAVEVRAPLADTLPPLSVRLALVPTRVDNGCYILGRKRNAIVVAIELEPSTM